MGGAIFLLENATEKRHDLLSSFYGASSIGGSLLASLGVYLISHYQMIDSGWRFLYLGGCITALFGCFIRRSSYPPQSPLKFLQTMIHLKTALWTHRKPMLFIAIGAGFSYATCSIALVLMNGLIPLISSTTKTEMMEMNTYLLILDFCTLPFFGWVASKISREKLMFLSSLGVVLFATPLLLSLENASLMKIAGVRVALVILGVAFFAPFHAWAQQLILPSCRYAVISFSYALGSQVLGSPTAAIALWCFQKTGMITSVGWYWMGLGVASSIIMALVLRPNKENIEKSVI